MAEPTSSVELERTDGRTARRDRNREAVLDAVLELFSEDAASPSPDDVAARSGVSLRSVYRYFDDMDSLVRSAIARHLSRVEPLFEVADPGQGTLHERVERQVEQRLRLFEAAGPVMRAALIRSRSNELIRERVEQSRRTLLDQVKEMFAPELAALGPAGGDAEAAVSLLLGFESIEHLRRDRSFSESDTKRILVGSATAILGV